MQSYYEINVSLNGVHFFATAPRSCVDKDKAEKVYKSLAKRFRKDEGFSITVCYWRAGGQNINFTDEAENVQS